MEIEFTNFRQRLDGRPLMVGDAAVWEAELLTVVGLVGTEGGHFFVEIDAESGAIGRIGKAFVIGDAAAVKEIFPVLFVAAVCDFLDGEVGDAGGDLQARRRADRGSQDDP